MDVSFYYCIHAVLGLLKQAEKRVFGTILIGVNRFSAKFSRRKRVIESVKSLTSLHDFYHVKSEGQKYAKPQN